ncbi:helix-turn-helix transcriptional regulator [Serratia marcescens]|uniref:helix-turn-helix transcriptional regulator n=1 Tax=Serratia marcescens TaxID=615 RepID=UPI000A73E7C6|nr:PAS and helix-turn-helix domain-containing protein [Serratia marcescens]
MVIGHSNDLFAQKQVDYIDLIRNFRSFWDGNNEPWGAKDMLSRFIYANKAYYDLINIPYNFNIESRLDSEIPAATSEFAIEFQNHDKKVISSNQSISSLEIHPFGKMMEIQPYIFEKFPLIHDGVIVGTIFHGKKATLFSTEMLLQTQTPTSFMVTPPSTMFTDREWQVIFLLNHRYTSKEIAQKLALSPKTIQNHIQRIYAKTGVNTINHFIEHCRELNYDKYLPKDFLKPSHRILG